MWRSNVEPKWSAVGKRTVFALPSAQELPSRRQCIGTSHQRRRPRCAVRTRRRCRALLRFGRVRVLRRRAARRRTWSAATTSGCTTSTGRSSTPSGHTGHVLGRRDRRRPAHHRLARSPRQGERRHQEPCGRLHRANSAARGGGELDGKRIISGGNDKIARGGCSTAPKWTPSGCTSPRCASRRCPTTSTPSGSNDRTIALQRQRRRRPAHLEAPHGPGDVFGCCCPMALLRQRLDDRTACIVEHGLAPHRKLGESSNRQSHTSPTKKCRRLLTGRPASRAC